MRGVLTSFVGHLRQRRLTYRVSAAFCLKAQRRATVPRNAQPSSARPSLNGRIFLCIKKKRTNRFPRKTSRAGGNECTRVRECDLDTCYSWVYAVTLAVQLSALVYFWVRNRSLHTRVDGLADQLELRTTELDTAQQTLRRLAGKTGATSLANHSSFQEGLGGEWRRALREGLVNQRPDDQHRPLQRVQRRARTPDR